MELTSLCNEDCLIFPREVCDELNRHAKDDHLSEWARENKKKACRFGRCNDELNKVMNHSVAQLIVDPDESLGPERADPHILATALKASKEYPPP